VKQTGCSRDVGVDNIANSREFLVEKRVPESTPCIRHEHVDGTAFGRRVELVDSFLRGEVDVESLDGACARLTSQAGGRLLDLHLIRGNQQIVSFARANARANS
jgi:hypothetical protein